MNSSYPSYVTIIEVGPRDGLQNEKVFIPTEQKINFIQKLKQAGVREMELTSFVSPKWVPQMSDARDVVAACVEEDQRHFVLAPNRRGLEHIRLTPCKHIAVFVGVSDTFNQKNINKSTFEALAELIPLIVDLRKDGYFIRACISTAFYCPYEGKIEEQSVLSLCEMFVEAGVNELSVADTIGLAAPHESYSLFSQIINRFPNTLITAHFHDTRGLALTNIYAALQAGVTRFDTSAGGLGGCPFAPGATGNVATEDVVYMLERMGVSTGINPRLIVEAVNSIQANLSRDIQSFFSRTKT